MMQDALRSPRRMRWRLIVWIALFSIISIIISILEISRYSDGLRIERTTIGEIPMTIFKPATFNRTPVVVVTHGFAGSQQMMQPMAATLARNGYVAITFDFAGHGRNPKLLTAALSISRKARGCCSTKSARSFASLGHCPTTTDTWPWSDIRWRPSWSCNMRCKTPALTR